MLFFFNDTATTEIYTLSLHDALPIFGRLGGGASGRGGDLRRWALHAPGPPASGRQPLELSIGAGDERRRLAEGDRKSTRLKSSHANISYAVFCLKKKKNR